MADFFFAEGELDYATETLLGKKYAGDAPGAATALQAVTARVEGSERWEHEALEGAIRPLAQELSLKAGDLFGLIRVAVSGKTVSPPLFETMAVLGRERTLERLRWALRQLGAASE
jgi:glutamyl-tRNA synthetase